MGQALGIRLSMLGHPIIYGSREPEREDVQELVAKTNHKANATSVIAASQQAETIILATPYHAIKDTVTDLGTVDNKILIDVTNGLKMGKNGLMEMATDTSSGEELQVILPKARVVKALNTVGFHIIAKPDQAKGKVISMTAGNDESAKKEVMKLITSLGLDTMDIGPITQSRFLEGMSALYITPYLTGRIDEAFEYSLLKGTSPLESKGVRTAG